MNLNQIVSDLKNCPCGRRHTLDIREVAIGRGLLPRTGELLSANGFPKNLLLVTDRNELRAAAGIREALASSGFRIKELLYPDLRIASAELVEEVRRAAGEAEGILSAGSGSCNDICRRAALLSDRAFAIFATAPSMDGFASDTAPIIENGFKISRPARQPSVIVADTDILAAAPTELKSAGFGDMIAKCIGLADWRITNLVTGEYLCPAVASLTREAFRRISALAGRMTDTDPAAAGAVMEALVLTGVAMKFTGNSRPASGAEHIVSHYWAIKEEEAGRLPDYHGKTVGVATLALARIYHALAAGNTPVFHADGTDMDEVYRVYGEHFRSDVEAMNTPVPTASISPSVLSGCWGEICRAIREEIPEPAQLADLMRQAGSALSYREIGITHALALDGLRYHAYMRSRITLMRLLPMIGYTPDWDTALGEK